MLVVNLFGGPGVGKTTLRSLLFAELKMRGGRLVVEEAAEVAKPAALEGRAIAFRNRIKLLGDQYHCLLVAETGGADVLVTDGPVFQNVVYAAREGWPPDYAGMCLWAHARHPSFNVLVERRPEHGFQQAGRREDEASSAAADRETEEALGRAGIPFVRAWSSAGEAARLAAEVVARTGEARA